MSLKFTCPHCKNHRLEEIMVGVVVASEISSIGEDGDLDYGEQTNDDGEVSQYQCISCGYIIGEGEDEPITDCVEMAEWVKENCPQENRPCKWIDDGVCVESGKDVRCRGYDVCHMYEAQED